MNDNALEREIFLPDWPIAEKWDCSLISFILIQNIDTCLGENRSNLPLACTINHVIRVPMPPVTPSKPREIMM